MPPKGGLVSQRYELENDILKFPDSTPKLPPDAKRSLSKSQNLHLGFSTLYGGVDLSANPKTAHMAAKPRMNEAWQITEEEILQMQIKTLDPECLSQAEDRIAYCMGTALGDHLLNRKTAEIGPVPLADRPAVIAVMQNQNDLSFTKGHRYVGVPGREHEAIYSL